MIASQHSIGAAHYVLCVLACVCQVLGATGAAATLDSDVLIVGSGMAGLTVAHELHKAGVRSVILEATDRIGGRMYSQPWDIAGDPTRRVVVEMGAQWIHGIDHNPIYKIAQELELEMYETPVHTGRHPDKFDAFFEAEQDGTTRQLVDHQDVLKLLQGVDDFRAAVKEARKLGMPDESLQQFGDRLINQWNGTCPDLARGVGYQVAQVANDNAADPSELSVLQSLDPVKSTDGTWMIFKNGYTQVLTPFRKHATIIHNATVTTINHQHKRRVTVTTADGRSWVGRYVVVTVPLGVLKAGSIEFQPPLPVWKQRAIGRVGFGRLHKTYLAFDGPPFWDTERFWITRVMPPHTPYTWSYFGNMYHAKGQPILYAENQGSYAERLEGMSVQQVVDEAMVVLREMYGDDIPDPIDAVASGWHTVPTAHGTYSNLPPNTTSKDMQELGRSVGHTLHFAGEACSAEYFGYVHGAHYEGKRAAAEIIKHLKGGLFIKSLRKSDGTWFGYA